MRGEQKKKRRQRQTAEGSPPLARGTAVLAKIHQIVVRITPACAGNRGGRMISVITPQDHPRLRGEQAFSLLLSSSRLGSPPLARGTVFTTPRTRGGLGITPACAGNSCFRPHAGGYAEDHPRLRGEQLYGYFVGNRLRGSPPLARGTVLKNHNNSRKARITPACAGNRYMRSRSI